MKNKKTFLVIVILFVVLLVGAYVLYGQLSDKMENDPINRVETENESEDDRSETQKEADKRKIPAPDFTVYDADENEVHLSDYFGKPIVVNFWASWCGPCKSEMPDFQEVYEEMGEDVQFLMINMTDGSRETVETAGSYVQSKGFTFPVFYDLTFDAAGKYGAQYLPTTFFIDAEGNVIGQVTSAMNKETMMKGIDLILPK